MADTIIQIKRSTTNTAPASLLAGELAYSGNTQSEQLFIGHPSDNTVVAVAGLKYNFLQQANTSNATHAVVEGGKLTANAVLITDANSSINEIRTANLVINTSGNTSVYINEIVSNGSFVSASNTQLATAWAIKDYVDNNSAATLAGMDDVTITSAANNNLLVYDAAAGDWENHTVSGTAEQIEAFFDNHNLTIALYSDVKISSSFTAGNNTVYSTVNTTAVSTTNLIASGNTTTNTANVTSALYVGSNTYITPGSIRVGNSSVNTIITPTSIDIDGDIIASGNGTFTGNVNTATLNVGANVSVTATGVSVGNSSVNTTVNATALSTTNLAVSGNVGSNLIPSANVTYDLGSASQAWESLYANNGILNYITVNHDLSVSGNLNVSGSLVTINVATLSVTDPLIHLAVNNATSDLIDVGFYGQYGNSSVTKYTGLFRDQDDGIYKLFTALEAAPDTQVDTANTTYRIATLQAYLLSGGIVSNSTTVAITANSTVNVALVANTLSLTTALGVASGGTGAATFTNNAVLFGYGTGALQQASGSNGQVLQITGNVPTFGGLDGGAF